MLQDKKILVILHVTRKRPEVQSNQWTFLRALMSKEVATQLGPRNSNPKRIARSQVRYCRKSTKKVLLEFRGGKGHEKPECPQNHITDASLPPASGCSVPFIQVYQTVAVDSANGILPYSCFSVTQKRLLWSHRCSPSLWTSSSSL